MLFDSDPLSSLLCLFSSSLDSSIINTLSLLRTLLPLCDDFLTNNISGDPISFVSSISLLEKKGFYIRADEGWRITGINSFLGELSLLTAA